MRRLALGVVVLLVMATPADADPINAVIGDRSWTESHDGPPDDAPEVLRIRTHLRYVHDLLSRAPAELLAHRRQALAALDTYIALGEFPRRTGDPYAGRRPRFIDDRGIHCAVGYLLAATGEGALARAIDAAHEYAYIRDLEIPAVHAWAAKHGFSIDDLAMIQPGYKGGSYPTESAARSTIDHAARDHWLFCAASHPPSATVELEVTDTPGPNVIATTSSTDPFARCLADQVKMLLVGGSDTPTSFTFKMTVAIRPQPLFAEVVAGLAIAKECTPLPGAVPTSAALDLATDRTGVTARATTTPENLEVNRCLERAAVAHLHAFATIAGLRATRRIAIESRVDPKRLSEVVAFLAPPSVTQCYPEEKALRGVLKLRVSAVRDGVTFAISDDSGQPAFSACLRGELLPQLHDHITVNRVVGGKIERYRRIDRDVDVTVPVPAISPEKRER